MRKSRLSEEQIIGMLREPEAGRRFAGPQRVVADVLDHPAGAQCQDTGQRTRRPSGIRLTRRRGYRRRTCVFARAALFPASACASPCPATSWARSLAIRSISFAGTGSDSGKRIVPRLIL